MFTDERARHATAPNPNARHSAARERHDALTRESMRVERALSTRSGSTRSARSHRATRAGEARVSLLVGAAVACAAIVAALVLALRPGAETSRSHAEAASADRRAQAPLLSGDVELPDRSHAARPDSKGGALSPRSFEGRGAIRGELVPAPGVRIESAWTLVVEPSPVLTGKERAQTRRIERAAHETTFVVEDLPLAGYRVRAEFPTLNGKPIDVLLVASSPAAYVTLAVAPSGTIDGIVLQSDGAPADDFEVTLEERLTHLRRSARTDVNGAYVLRDVLDGEYWLHFGPPDAPLAARADLLFVAPRLRVPTRTLPALGALRLRAYRPGFGPLSDAHAIGSTDAGGTFDVATDAHGIALARYLLPGTWRIEATRQGSKTLHLTVEVAAGTTNESEFKFVE